jgi:integral membrane sensor domain MASE1
LQLATVSTPSVSLEEDTLTAPASFFGPSFHGTILRLLAVGLIYFIGSWAGIILGKSPAQADVIWPANGLLLGLLLMSPRRRWPSYLACAAAVTIAIHNLFSFPTSRTLIFAAANTAEVLSVALLMRSRNRRPDLTRPATLMLFLLCAVAVAPLLSTLVVGIGEYICGLRFGFPGLRDWYLGDVLGLAIITPCVLAMRQREVLTWLHPGKRLEAFSLLGGLVLLTFAIFYRADYPVALVLSPLLLLIVYRLGTSGGAVGILLLAGPAA